MKQIVGLDSLLSKLSSMGGNVAEALTRAVYTTTLKAMGDAKRMVPVRTGELKTSISAEVKKNSQGAEGKVYTNKPYAVFVELGTTHQSAKPYLEPAAKQNEGTFQSEAANELEKAIRKMGG